MNELSNYEKQQYSGNENGWDEPIKSLGVTAITEAIASELNSHFRNTGVKYVLTDKVAFENTEVTENQADHGERNLIVKDGSFVPTDNKPKEKIEGEQGAEFKSDGTEAVKSDGEAIKTISADKTKEAGKPKTKPAKKRVSQKNKVFLIA